MCLPCHALKGQFCAILQACNVCSMSCIDGADLCNLASMQCCQHALLLCFRGESSGGWVAGAPVTQERCCCSARWWLSSRGPSCWRAPPARQTMLRWTHGCRPTGQPWIQPTPRTASLKVPHPAAAFCRSTIPLENSCRTLNAGNHLSNQRCGSKPRHCTTISRPQSHQLITVCCTCRRDWHVACYEGQLCGLCC